MFAALEDFDAEFEINTPWETIRISKFQPKDAQNYQIKRKQAKL
jgi:hypothetical protein